MNRMQIALLTVVALSWASGDAVARDPNKVRCRAVANDGAQLDVRYEAERREFRADFSVGAPSRDAQDRWRAVNRQSGNWMARFAPGDALPVWVDGERVGTIVLDASLSGSLRFDEDADRASRSGDRPFPPNFPPFPPGTVTKVGTISCVGQRR